MGNIQKPRRHCLVTHRAVMVMIGVFREEDGINVEYDKDGGTLKALIGDIIIYQGFQKGRGEAPWTVAYRTDYLS